MKNVVFLLLFGMFWLGAAYWTRTTGRLQDDGQSAILAITGILVVMCSLFKLAGLKNSDTETDSLPTNMESKKTETHPDREAE